MLGGKECVSSMNGLLVFLDLYTYMVLSIVNEQDRKSTRWEGTNT